MQIAVCTRRRGRKGHPPSSLPPKSALLSFVDKEQSLKSHHFLKVRQRKIEMSHSNGCTKQLTASEVIPTITIQIQFDALCSHFTNESICILPPFLHGFFTKFAAHVAAPKLFKHLVDEVIPSMSLSILKIWVILLQ